MKFISVQSARNLKIGVPVYTLNDKGEYGLGRLASRNETIKGLELTFEAATFAENGHPPDIKATEVKNITHIATIKPQDKIIQS